MLTEVVLAEWRAELERVEKDRNPWAEVAWAADYGEELLDEIRDLRQALGVYADLEHWRHHEGWRDGVPWGIFEFPADERPADLPAGWHETDVARRALGLPLAGEEEA